MDCLGKRAVDLGGFPSVKERVKSCLPKRHQELTEVWGLPGAELLNANLGGDCSCSGFWEDVEKILGR